MTNSFSVPWASMPKSRLTRAMAIAMAMAMATVGMAAGGCGHGAPPPSAAGKPIVAAVLPQVTAEARAEFEGALRLLKQGKTHHAEARAKLLKATALDPKFFEAWHDLGWLDASRGNFARAAAAFGRALDIQPGSRETALALGETWRRAGYAKKAAKLYGERLTAEPGDTELRNRYIQVLRDGGDLEEAMTQTKFALGQAGENVAQSVFAYNSLGLIYYKMEKLELAETALRKAVELDGNSAFVWNNLGLVAFARGRDQEAFLNFQKASELDPKYVEARLNKAIIFMDCGDYKHAHAELATGGGRQPGRRRRVRRAGRRGPRQRQAGRGAPGLREGSGDRAGARARPVRPGPFVHGVRQGSREGARVVRPVRGRRGRGRSQAQRRGRTSQGPRRRHHQGSSKQSDKQNREQDRRQQVTPWMRVTVVLAVFAAQEARAWAKPKKAGHGPAAAEVQKQKRGPPPARPDRGPPTNTGEAGYRPLPAKAHRRPPTPGPPRPQKQRKPRSTRSGPWTWRASSRHPSSCSFSAGSSWNWKCRRRIIVRS